MSHATLTPRMRGVVGLTSLIAGAGVLVAAMALPAAAHKGKEPDKRPENRNLSCAELADKYGVEAAWTEFKIEAGELPAEGESRTYVLSDRGTPDDDSDDATVTITVIAEQKAFNWTSNFTEPEGIDAIYVKGGSEGSWFYGYQPDVDVNGNVTFPGAEARSGDDLGTPPYWTSTDHYNATKNQISHVTFCWDDEGSTTTTSSSSTTTSTSTTMPSETPPSTPGPTTTTSIELSTDTLPPSSTTTAAIDLSADTTVLQADVATNQDTLPRTGSNTTGLLLALGGVLVVGGGALLATTRIVRRRGG